MRRLFTLLFILSISILITSCGSDHADSELGPPSDGAKGMPGALGTFAFNPEPAKQGPTYWVDSDGVDPGVAGCHAETDSNGVVLKNGRHFGEMCLDGNILVESNPAANVVHKHSGDTGHPDQFSCNDWCLGEAGSGGSCVVVDPIAPCSLKSPHYPKSAMCVCK